MNWHNTEWHVRTTARKNKQRAEEHETTNALIICEKIHLQAVISNGKLDSELEYTQTKHRKAQVLRYIQRYTSRRHYV